MLTRYVDQVFNEGCTSILVDFRIKTIELDKQIFNLQIWEADSRWHPLNKAYLTHAVGIILVYDCTSEESFKNLKFWNDLINEYPHKCLTKVIVGNKCDRNDKVIEKSMGEEFANGINARFFETSAKDDINVNEVFKHMLCEIKKFVDWIGDNAGIIIKQSKVKGTKNFMHLIDKRQ